jgi:hypothetical protein
MSGQVTGDLWERYMVMLTQENKLEVYASLFPTVLDTAPSHYKTLPYPTPTPTPLP